MTLHMKKETARLKSKVLKLCSMVEENVRKSVDAVSNLDIDLAIKVKERDDDIDSMEVELEEECLKILALYQPVANDLRYVIACLKMNNDLERIGDLAVNIAKRAIEIAKYSDEDIVLDFYPLMEKTQAMLKKSLDSLVEMNDDLAIEVLTADDEIDKINKKNQSEIMELIKKNPEKVAYYLQLLSVSRHLERIADYASNIAEDVIYMVTGRIIRHGHEPIMEKDQK